MPERTNSKQETVKENLPLSSNPNVSMVEKDSECNVFHFFLSMHYSSQYYFYTLYVAFGLKSLPTSVLDVESQCRT